MAWTFSCLSPCFEKFPFKYLTSIYILYVYLQYSTPLPPKIVKKHFFSNCYKF